MPVEISCNGFALTRLCIYVPGIGPWYADCDFADDAKDLKPGKVKLAIGDVIFAATLQASRDGTFGLSRRARARAGAGGWGTEIPFKAYHNDARVPAVQVARDAATACGETLGAFAGGVTQLDVNYVREAGPASRTIEDVARGAPWWVGYDGVTIVGPRPAHTPPTDAIHLLQADPRLRRASYGVDDADAIRVGDTLTDERLGAPLQVKALEIIATPRALRVSVWGGAGGSGERSLLADSVARVVRKVRDERLHGIYRYRVITMTGDRVNLAPIAAGLPPLNLAPMWPGVAGAHANLSPGMQVGVQFLDGDRAFPVITHFVGRGGNGEIPVRLEFGGAGGADAARKGDTVQGVMPPAVFQGMITVAGTPSPAVGAIIWNPPQFIATITDGSSLVGIKT